MGVSVTFGALRRGKQPLVGEGLPAKLSAQPALVRGQGRSHLGGSGPARRGKMAWTAMQGIKLAGAMPVG